MNKKYLFHGSYRKQNSIGNMEDFTIEWESISPLEAMGAIRENFYNENYDHILFKECFCDGQEISMLEALELE